jgi:hypothetical protein
MCASAPALKIYIKTFFTGPGWNSSGRSGRSKSSKNVSNGTGSSPENTDDRKSIERPLATMESSEQLRQNSFNASTEETESRTGFSEDIEMGSFFDDSVDHDSKSDPQIAHLAMASNMLGGAHSP